MDPDWTRAWVKSRAQNQPEDQRLAPCLHKLDVRATHLWLVSHERQSLRQEHSTKPPGTSRPARRRACTSTDRPQFCWRARILASVAIGEGPPKTRDQP